MLTRLDTIDKLLMIAAQIRAEHRKYAKMQERASAAVTPKQHQKANTDLNWQAFHIVRLETALHAAAVDAGVADLRERQHYAPRAVKLTGFHEYELVPALPAQINHEVRAAFNAAGVSK